jgi:hypothetical protein
VYRLFFISKAPSFYIIRSSLVLTGGVYGEQVNDNKLFVDIAMNWVVGEEAGDYIESRISLSHRYLCMYDVWRGFLASADTEFRSYLCDWIERYAIDELKFPPEFRLKRPEEIGLFLDFDDTSDLGG